MASAKLHSHCLPNTVGAGTSGVNSGGSDLFSSFKLLQLDRYKS